jgi:hypothetical protein
MTRTVFLAVVVGVAAAPFELWAQQAPAGASAATAQDPREADVRQMIEGYFRSWSRQDMDRYGRCFLPQAAVQVIDEAGRLGTMPLGPFLNSQKLAHKEAKKPLTETPERIDVRFEGKLARAVVYWKLVGDEKVEYGYDHFTLMETAGGWRIANLIFYSEGNK